MATHSSVLAWRIPGTGEPGGPPVCGVAQSRTRLKLLSSISSSCLREIKMSDTCSLFPPFGDPWLSCLLPYQQENSLSIQLRRRAEIHTWRGVWMSWVRRNTVWMCSNHLYRAALLGLYLWPIILFLSSHLTIPRTFPKMCVQLSSKMYPSIEACGCMSTLIMVWGPFPLQPQRRVPKHVQTGKSSLTSGVGTFSLCFSRIQLLPLALSLECLGENKAWISLHLTNTRCLAQRSAVTYLSIDRVEMVRGRHRQSRSGEGLRALKWERDS